MSLFQINETFIAENKPLKELTDIESLAPTDGDKIYSTIQELLDTIPSIKSDEKCVVCLLNGESGFVNQLTVISQNMNYLQSLNSEIIVIPCFNKNNKNFKYAEEGYQNSFFLYFKMKKHLKYPLSSYNKYFVNNFATNNYPNFHENIIPTIKDEDIKQCIFNFIENFEFIKNPNVEKEMNKLKRPIIGIHIRSLYKKVLENPEYLSIPLDERLKKISESLQGTDYSLFIMTDVDDYISLAKRVFGKEIYYIENINRIPTGDVDSMPSMTKTGYELGADILNECYAMSLCDKVYVSYSNIPLLISIMNPYIDMMEY